MQIILVALEAELPRDMLPNHHIEYTGVGKINAALKAAQVISEYQPKQIINFGTAGCLNTDLAGLVEVADFYQRDMDVRPLGFEIGQTPFEEQVKLDFGRAGYSCSSGDNFVTEPPELQTDLVDMEAYAIAKACYAAKIDFRCFKYISDKADGSASTSWQENVVRGKSLFASHMLNIG